MIVQRAGVMCVKCMGLEASHLHLDSSPQNLLFTIQLTYYLKIKALDVYDK